MSGLDETAASSIRLHSVAETFIPLFSSTVRSSLWSLNGDCIKIFLTLALEAGPDGVVVASVDGIRRIVDMPIADVQRHLLTLESPDQHSKDLSRDPNADGRRIERLHNGWRVVNMEWYREESRRQAELFRKRKYWEEKGSAARRDARRMYTDTDTDTERDTDPDRSDSPGKPAPKAKRAVQMPDDFAPDEGHRSLAAELGVSLQEEFPKFHDHHLAKGSRFVRWDLALRTWLRNAKTYSRGRHGPANGIHPSGLGTQKQVDRVMQFMKEEQESEKK